MTAYRYKYSFVPQHSKLRPFPEARFIFYPLVKVGLAANGKGIKTIALIDTGAQYCFFDNQYAKVLGITNYKNTPHKAYLTGIGGKNPENTAYFHDLKLLVYKPGKFFGTGKPWEIETKIGFLEKSTNYSAIIGEYGFFDYFAFNCVLPESYFELKHIDE